MYTYCKKKTAITEETGSLQMHLSFFFKCSFTVLCSKYTEWRLLDGTKLVRQDNFPQQIETEVQDLPLVARPCTLPLGQTHLPLSGSVDPCGMPDLITFTFKQTVLAL